MSSNANPTRRFLRHEYTSINSKRNTFAKEGYHVFLLKTIQGRKAGMTLLSINRSEFVNTYVAGLLQFMCDKFGAH
jgi:hypothetical protein